MAAAIHSDPVARTDPYFFLPRVRALSLWTKVAKAEAGEMGVVLADEAAQAIADDALAQGPDFTARRDHLTRRLKSLTGFQNGAGI